MDCDLQSVICCHVAKMRDRIVAGDVGRGGGGGEQEEERDAEDAGDAAGAAAPVVGSSSTWRLFC